MADIKTFTMPTGTVYDLVDQGARDLIAQLGNYTEFLGVTSDALVDGSTTNPVTINGESVTARTGDIVTYGSAEFIWNGSAWQLFGDLSGLGSMAFANTASGDYTPFGTVTLLSSSAKAVVSPAESGEATYTPAGTIAFSEATRTPTISASAGTQSDNTFQVAGSVGAPAISLSSAGATSTIHNPTKATVMTSFATAAPGATAPSNAITYYDVVNESLRFYQMGYITGDSITTSDVTVKTGDATYSASAPSFTGDYVKLVPGGISVPTSAEFSGSAVRLVTDDIPTVSSASFSGTSATITVTPDAVGE